MSDYVPPCADPKNNPDDWFIEKDGKQYPDDDLLGQERRDKVYSDAFTFYVESGEYLGDETEEEARASAEAAVEVAEAEALKGALQRRRWAKDMCWRDCYVRAGCLQVGLDMVASSSVQVYGIRGAYYPEELRKIDDERKARAERRAAG